MNMNISKYCSAEQLTIENISCRDTGRQVHVLSQASIHVKGKGGELNLTRLSISSAEEKYIYTSFRTKIPLAHMIFS